MCHLRGFNRQPATTNRLPATFRADLIFAVFPFSLQDIDYESFRRFLNAFLDYETPEELVKHLFISFLSPQITALEHQGKIFNQMAAISTNAACAPVTSHSRGNMRACLTIALIHFAFHLI